MGTISCNRIDLISFFGHFEQLKSGNIYYKVYPEVDNYIKQLQSKLAISVPEEIHPEGK